MEHLIAAIDPELSSAAGGSPPFEPSSPERSAHSPYADNQGNFYYENGGANNTSYQSTNHARTTSNTATTTKRATWQSMFQQLQHFYDRHGHIDVPKTSTLAFWSCSQRRQYRIYAGPEDGLPPHLKPRLLKEPKGIIKTRINQLNTLGFVWFVKTEATQTNVAFGSAATATRAVIPKSQEELRTTTTEPEDEAEPNETALAAMAKGGCGKCEVCVRPDVDCRECKFCLDMRKYGGPNVLRKRCLLRRKLCLVNFPQPVQKPRKSAKMPAKKRSTATNSSRRSGVRESIAVRKAKATAAKYLPPKKTRAPRGCGTCNVCLQPDCRKCKFCIDMRKYGGPNVLRKRCMHRLKCPVTSPQPIKLGIPPPALLREKKTVKRKAPEKQAATITVQTPRGRIRKISRKMQESYDPSGTGVTTTQPEAILDDEEDEEVAVEEEPDESEEEDGKPRYVNPSPRIKGQSFFPWQLFTMVTETTVDNPHILEWLPCGSAFRIHNQDIIGPVLKKYFRHDKYSSFQRQLNLYGFKKHIKGYYEGAFHHPHFHRDQSDSETIAKYIYKKGTQVEEVPLSATTARRSKRKPSVNDTKPRPRATRTSPRATRGVEPMNQKNGTIPKHALLASKSNEPMSEENSSKDHSSTGGDSDPFPVLLYEIVSDLSKTNPDVINWLPSGDGFVVSKTSEEELGPFLLKYFNHDKYKSFQRQLNNYDFHKYTKGKFEGAFHHPDFRRGASKAKLRKITRKHKRPFSRRRTRSSSRIRGGDPNEDSNADSNEESSDESNDDEQAALHSPSHEETDDEDEAAPKVGTGRTKKVAERKRRPNIRRVEKDSDDDSDNASEADSDEHSDGKEDNSDEEEVGQEDGEEDETEALAFNELMKRVKSRVAHGEEQGNEEDSVDENQEHSDDGNEAAESVHGKDGQFDEESDANEEDGYATADDDEDNANVGSDVGHEDELEADHDEGSGADDVSMGNLDEEHDVNQEDDE